MTNYEWKLYFGDPHYGNLEYFNTDSILTLRYLLIYFFEYCATLGILDVAYKHPSGAKSDHHSYWGTDHLPFLSHCDGLMYIRLTELGAFVLDIADEYGVDSINNYEIEKTDIVFTGSCNPLPDHSIYLDKIAEQTEVNRWHFSPASLLNAVRDGETIRGIKKFIEKITLSKINKDFETLFKETDSSSAQVMKKGTATLLECQLQIYNQILVDKKLSRLCLPAGDRHIVILPGKDTLFTRRLEAIGLIIGN